MTSLRKYVGRTLVVIASVLAALAMVECSVRVSGIAPLPETPAGGHPLLRLLQPKVCKSLGSAEGAYFVEACTNQLGLRDREHRSGEAPRVLGLGDSSTFGWGVEQNDTFLSHLERTLRLALPEVKPGVWNAGLGYTSQAHQDALLRHVYEKIDPDLVVVAFSEDNDIDENIVWNPNIGVFPELGRIPESAVEAYRRGKDVASRDFLFRHSALVRLFRTRHQRASVAAERRAVDAALETHGLSGAPVSRMVADEARRRFLQAFSHIYDDDWEVTEILLERVRRHVGERGGQLVLLRIPSRMAVEDGSWASSRERFCGADAAAIEKRCGALDRAHTARRLGAYASANGIVYVDPESDLRAATDRGELMFHAQDIHMTRLGHARVGERLARAVVPLLDGKLPGGMAARPEPPASPRRVGAYWYPWYRGTDWASFTDYTPKGGAYVSSSPEAIQKHLHAAERAEIDFLVLELQAAQNAEAELGKQAVDAMVNALLERRRRGYSRLEFAVLSDIDMGDAEIMTPDKWLEATRRHLDHIWAHFVEPHRDAYAHVDGKPLVGIFSPEVSIDDARFTVIRPYWVSHEQWKDWGRKDELLPFWDIAPQTVTDPRFMTVVPGYNDARLERQPQVAPYLPRGRGRTLVEQWRRVFETSPDVALVYSYNEYFEQTHIEPTVEQGDRYLVLNQMMARRFKDGLPAPDEAEAEWLVEAVEPPSRPDEEKVAWLAVGDPRVGQNGLKIEGNRAALHGEAELVLDVDADRAFVVGIGHEPTLERCTGLSVTIAEPAPEKTASFATEITQLSILRDSPVAKTASRLKLRVRKVAASGCESPGPKPIALTGIARYAITTAERLNFRVDDPRIDLDGFWDLEPHPAGAFAWSIDGSSIKLKELKPGTRHRVTLTFRDTAGFSFVDLGADPGRLRRIQLSPARTATLEEPGIVAPDGTLTIHMKTQTWRPRDRFGSEDPRTLGVALRLVTLDKVEAPDSPP